MKSITSCLICILTLFLSSTVNAHKIEPTTIRTMENRVIELFHKEDYQALETMAQEFRETKSRTPSGLWQLSTFYYGLSFVLTARSNNKPFWWKTDKELKNWIAAFPESPTPHLAYATMLLNHAYSYRGGGLASSVKHENWKPFKRLTEQARDYLEKAKPIASSDPQWYALMARAAVFQGWSENPFASLLTEAFEREPLYYLTYYWAVLYYSPRWYGSVAEIETFARKALKQTRFQEGHAMYARVYWFASQTEFNETLFTESQVNWEKMKKGIDDILKNYPDNWNINNLAKFACLARDKEKAGELINRIEHPLHRDVWDSSSFFHRCMKWANTGSPRG